MVVRRTSSNGCSSDFLQCLCFFFAGRVMLICIINDIFFGSKW